MPKMFCGVFHPHRWGAPEAGVIYSAGGLGEMFDLEKHCPCGAVQTVALGVDAKYHPSRAREEPLSPYYGGR